MSTPAEEILAAARKLRRAAKNAAAVSPGPWTVDDDRVVRCADGKIVADRSCADIGDDIDLPYIATMHPEIGMATAHWLGIAAGYVQKAHPDLWLNSPFRIGAIILARKINGTLGDEPETEAEHYGIRVTYYGEDGEMLALGHHEPRRALAAFNRHARTLPGLVNIADDRSALAQDWLDAIGHGWFTFRTPDPNDGDDPEYTWMASPTTSSDPHGWPVTLLES